MHIITTLSPIDAPGGSAVALGFFDGVHLGHRAVLGAAVEYATVHSLTAAAFTFSLPANHPMKGGRIFPDREKHRRVAELGITEYQEAPFDAFCSLTPEDFVEKVLVQCFCARAVFCGDNFTFGARASGNVTLLQQLCAEHGIETHVVQMARYQGETVSSTRIRAALEECRIEDANCMLGEPYSIDWQVQHGKHVGTSRLGTPTINQNYPSGALEPGCGVYLTRIQIGGQWYPAATGIGRRPTVDQAGAPITCETYVPGFSGDVYGQMPRLEFHKYLCPVHKFDSMQQLSDLIHEAARQSQAYFAAQKSDQ